VFVVRPADCVLLDSQLSELEKKMLFVRIRRACRKAPVAWPGSETAVYVSRVDVARRDFMETQEEHQTQDQIAST
jgi:hypothetical protein